MDIRNGFCLNATFSVRTIRDLLKKACEEKLHSVLCALCWAKWNTAITEYSPKKNPRPIYDHDWMIKELAKIAPYDEDNLSNNTGFFKGLISAEQ